MSEMPEIACATCRWFSGDKPALSTGIARVAGADLNIGVCQFRAPTAALVVGMRVSFFPEVHATRSCGDWDYEDDDGGGGEEEPTTVTPFRRVA
ncbi:MAG: hypothetical protein ACRYHC_01735 [Janthinobacterium lividum]